jgi:bifunctional UDP-N-acetylglucosamine pyrophosphorylase/glucosamine-1-phosphate N-acetyltransferase
MKSSLAKVLHPVAGRPMIEHVARQAIAAGASPIIVVVGTQADQVRTQLCDALPLAPLAFAEQPVRRGTGDAVGRARQALAGFDGDVLILCGDVPALPPDAVKALVRTHRQAGAALTVLTALLDDPTGYGRIVRNAKGQIRAIVEQRDCSESQRAIREINTGSFCVSWPLLVEALDEIEPSNDQGEYYLTDAVRVLLAKGHHCEAAIHARPIEAMGVNSRRQLATMAQIINQRILEGWMDAGVTLVDPATTWIDAEVTIGRDSVIYPGVALVGATQLGERVIVRQGSRLEDTIVGNGTEILDHVVAVKSVIGAESHVGPFAHLRPDTVLAPECKIGNFVETKKARFGKGSKASHLSYLGDAEIGSGVNIGAGTITCNYDGFAKHQTVIEDEAFIGSNTSLVAPLKIGRGAIVAAGSAITQEVPPDALAFGRATQVNKEGRAAEIRKAKGKK